MNDRNSFKILNASAGSGKTYSLVKQYIEVLLKSDNPNKFRHLLAITFTNKAVAEMKNRVLDTLSIISTYQTGEETSPMLQELIATTKLPIETVVKKAGVILNSILHNYSAFDIVTIDTLTHRIIRTFAKDLEISGNFEVSLDQNTLNTQAVDALISKVGVDVEITETLVDFALEKADDDKSWDITRELYDVARLLQNENDIKALELLKNKSLQDFRKLSKSLNIQIKTLSNTLQQVSSELIDFIHALGLDKKSFKSGYYYNFITALAENRKNISFTGAKFKDNIETEPLYTKTQDNTIKSTIDTHRDTFIQTFFKLKMLHERKTLFEALRSKIIPLSVLQLIKKELDQIKDDENILLISDFNKLIAKSLRDQPAAFLYERLGERYTNYFVDEFQDTSILQWQNLIPLIDNSISSTSQDRAKNSLLIVGDPKQAIYRWRGGEAEQFINLSENKNPFSIPVEVDNLDTNYRSHAEVINFNNSFFTHIARHFDNSQYNSIYLKDNDQKLNHREGGYVSIDFVENNTIEESNSLYPDRVLQIINEVIEDGFSLSDICILTRNNNQGSIIAQYLDTHNISVISSESLLIANSKTVQFIHAFISMVLNPDQEETRLPVLYFLSEHLNIEKHHEFYAQSICGTVEEFIKSLEEYHIFFNLTHLHTLTLYESLEYIIQCFSLQNKSDAYILAYLDMAYNYSQKSSEGLNGFLRHWQDKKDKASIVVPQQNHAVQIMSIHKSKGLEFPVVIYPYADSKINRTYGEHQWYPLYEEIEGHSFPTLMVAHSSKLNNFGDVGGALYEQRQSEQQFDAINVLYVALTRAIRRLYVVSSFRESVTKTTSIADLFVEYLQTQNLWDVNKKSYSFGIPEKTTITEEKSTTEVFNIPFISNSKESLGVQIATQASFLWDEHIQNAITYGNLIHQIMAKIKVRDDSLSVVQDFVHSGIIQSSDKNTITAIINSVVNHTAMQNYFLPENKIINERMILSSDGKFHIPDRIETSPEGATTIIDYKTGEQSLSHHSQISTYSKLLEEMGFKVEKKFLVYINNKVDVIAV